MLLFPDSLHFVAKSTVQVKRVITVVRLHWFGEEIRRLLINILRFLYNNAY